MAHLRAGRPTASSRDPQTNTDDALTTLLDHIAAELAEEYVRLAEAAVTRKNGKHSASGVAAKAGTK
jgi:hypothetical protein